MYGTYQLCYLYDFYGLLFWPTLYISQRIVRVSLMSPQHMRSTSAPAKTTTDLLIKLAEVREFYFIKIRKISAKNGRSYLQTCLCYYVFCLIM